MYVQNQNEQNANILQLQKQVDGNYDTGSSESRNPTATRFQRSVEDVGNEFIENTPRLEKVVIENQEEQKVVVNAIKRQGTIMNKFLKDQEKRTSAMR